MKHKPWQANDAAWFEENSHRSHYARWAYIVEWPNAPIAPEGLRWATIIRQLTPEMRVRIAIVLVDDLELEAVPEEYVAALFDLADEQADLIGCVAVTFAELERRAASWREGNTYVH